MTEIAATPNDIYEPRKDDIYNTLKSKVPVDASTRYRINKHISGLNTSDSAGLNVNGKTTEFTIYNNQQSKMRWDTTAFLINATFNDNAGGAMTLAVPSPTAIVDQIESITLTAPKSSTQIFSMSGETFQKSYLARLLTSYDWDTLNRMDEQLFTPFEVEDMTTTITQAAGAPYAVSAVSVDENSPRYVFQGANATSNAIAALANCELFTTAQKIRQVRHRTNIYSQVISKVIPFNDAFPKFPNSIINNMDELKISIAWKDNSQTRGIETIANAADHAVGVGKILITGIEIIEDCYMPSITKEIETTGNKSGNVSEIIGYNDCEISTRSYVANSEIDCGNVKNLQAVMIIKDMYGATNATAATADQRAVYKSTCQFSLFDNQTGYAHSTVLRDCNVMNANNSIISSIQVSYGDDIIYPMRPITTKSGNSPVLTELYYEYLKALDAVSHKFIKPMPFSVFCTTMPFVFIKVFSNNGVHLCREGKPLTIKMTGGVSTNIHVICFTEKNLFIKSDGSISISQ